MLEDGGVPAARGSGAPCRGSIPIAAVRLGSVAQMRSRGVDGRSGIPRSDSSIESRPWSRSTDLNPAPTVGTGPPGGW
ncbi:MAG: hypothetical protein CMJ52_00360 [Planctomycetaceae bacterium]|nr:hypothetical protein [Planctomycetaceae bacterium]